MSNLPSLPRELYSRSAFVDFVGKQDFTIGDAKAHAWICQLAYDTTDPDKINGVLTSWELALVDDEDGIGVEEVEAVLPLASTDAFVAYGRGATIVAFAGTDPLVLANWITDFDVYIDRKTDTTRGYNSAVAAVWPRIKALAEKSVLRAGKLIIAGHSLGGALAVLTANRFARARRVVQCVYTFGMPRPGDPAFAAEYGELGDRTYRLVYQNDIVPTVRPSWLQFRHVGRFLHCDDSGKFDGRNLAPDCTSDAPQFVRGIGQQLRDFLHSPLSSVIEPLDRLKLAA